ncbi:MAG TPA: ABC-2 family transporter protein [Acidimicrobiales bacterium]|nr:ABC-2 family transporter protein [Acidimicrobiales bacterium]
MAELLARTRAAAIVYRRLVGARIRADWQYRTSFVMFTLSQFLVAALDFVAIIVIFGRVRAIAGWSLYEVLFLYGTSGVSFALADVLISSVERVASHIKLGTFDQFLLRPVGALLQLTCEDFALRRVGRLVQPAAALGIAIAHLPLAWTPARVLVLASTVASGTVLFASLWVIASSLAFWTVETQEVANSFTYGGGFITQYPLDVLGGWLRRMVLVVPIAFVTYLPSSWLLDRPDGLGVGGAVRLASPAVALVAAIAASAVWRSAIRHYRSTGS